MTPTVSVPISRAPTRGVRLELAEMVLDEQLAALDALEAHGRRPGPSGSGPTSPAIVSRARVVEIGMRVLTQAAVNAEDEARQIVVAAEVKAAQIVQEAHDDVDRLTTWLRPRVIGSERSARPDLRSEHGAGPGHAAPGPNEPQSQPHHSVEAMDDAGKAAADDFFDSYVSTDVDPWGFMADDELVGAGSGLFRRVMRRPAGPRPRPPV